MAFFAKRFFAQRFFAKRYWSSGEGVPGQLTGENANTAQGLLKPAIAVDLLGLVATTAYGELTPDIGAGGDVSVELLGLAASGSLGELHVVLDIPLVGEDAVTTQGTLGTSVDGSATVALTGLGAATAQGALGVEIDVALVGQGATTAQGDVTPDLAVVVDLTGLAAATGGGLLGVSIECLLGGLRATLAAGRINDYGRAPGEHDLWTRLATTALFVVAEAEEESAEKDDVSLVATQIDVFSTAATQSTDKVAQAVAAEIYALMLDGGLVYTISNTDLVVTVLDTSLFVVELETQSEVGVVEEDLIAA
jgi:hypothetical protein